LKVTKEHPLPNSFMGCSSSKDVTAASSLPTKSEPVEAAKSLPTTAQPEPASKAPTKVPANIPSKEVIELPPAPKTPPPKADGTVLVLDLNDVLAGDTPNSRSRFLSYASGASTPNTSSGNLSAWDPDDGSNGSAPKKNTKSLKHSGSAIGLDELTEGQGLTSKVVHIEVPFGKPIEEVYDGVHNGPVLGSGVSGLVRLATHKATGVEYAVKCLDLGLVGTAEGLQQLREEIFIMCQLDHPNIVRLEEVYESHSEIYLVQELCLGGELFDRLDEQPDYHYTEAECARLVKQMLSAVRYLHSKGIIHRDLKLENFLFSSKATDSELKMIDFGLSKHFRFGEVHHEAAQSRPTAREAQKHIWLKEWASRQSTHADTALNPNVVKALVNFKEFSDMRKLLSEVLSFTLLPDQIKELRKEFEKMDTDGSGEISLEALKQVLMTNAGAGSLGALSEEEVEDIFNAMRVNKSETRIHWHEFIAAGLTQCQVDDRNLRLAFDRLDSDHKGVSC